jgi:hypothetical protein
MAAGKQGRQLPRLRVGLAAASALLLTAIAVSSGLGGARPPLAPHTAPTSTSSRPSLLFTCPDGRLGLHIVHTRFLVSQAHTNLLFQGFRLQLLHTFFLPSLAAQSARSFVLYASYDPELSPALVAAMHDALALTGVHVTTAAEVATAMGRGFAELAAELTAVDPRVNDVDLFVTSRLDIDDTTHVGSVEAIQTFACSDGASAATKRGAAKASKGKETEANPPPVRVAYVQGGQLWFPSHKTSRPYGDTATWKTWKEGVYDDIYKFLAIMQSMILTGNEFIKKCDGLDVYAYPHYRPEALGNGSVALPPGCPRFAFKPDLKRSNRYMLLWDPPKGDIGNLYVRTQSSWTHEKIDLHHKKPAAADGAVMARSFGISPGDLAAANLLFAGFEEHTGDVLQNNSEIPIER